MLSQNFADLTSRTYVSQRLRLHYVDWGNPSAPPLLLIHGGRDHCRSWDWAAARLREDYHVIAPDLRGHGDSQWSPDGNYSMPAHVYDLAQLVHRQELAPVRIVAHSLGGKISLLYAGLYPELVEKMIVIEGIDLPPPLASKRAALGVEGRYREWIEQERALSGRQPKRYASIEEAFGRMRAENTRLTPEQAHYLTVQGINQNEDGTYSWKFDNYVRPIFPLELDEDEHRRLLSNITCPLLLIHGGDSWAPHPKRHLDYLRDARIEVFENSGHWAHHDQLDRFVATVRDFMAD